MSNVHEKNTLKSWLLIYFHYVLRQNIPLKISQTLNLILNYSQIYTCFADHLIEHEFENAVKRSPGSNTISKLHKKFYVYIPHSVSQESKGIGRTSQISCRYLSQVWTINIYKKIYATFYIMYIWLRTTLNFRVFGWATDSMKNAGFHEG